METHADRRVFLSTAGATALTAATYARVRGANERVGIGIIGYGLIGQTHVTTFSQLPEATVVAIADCHRGRVKEGVAATGGRATGYTDFRKLLDSKDVHAVIVATPDHWHALMTMLACDAGKDVYVEKPLTLFVREGQWMQTVAARTQRVIQVGTQQRSGPHYQKARDLIRRGHIGTVVSVRMPSIRNIAPGFGSPPDGPPPAELDYNLWLGPAPLRPYNPHRALYHFRWFWDYSGGQMTNLGAHHLDIVDWILGLQSLQAVMSIGGRYALTDNGETPDTQDALFDGQTFSAAFVMREAAHGERAEFGLTFYGTRGSLTINRSGFRVTPDPNTPAAQQIPGAKEGHPAGGPKAEPRAGPDQPRTEALEDTTGRSAAQYRAHARNFLECIKSRKTPIADLASAHRTAVACHLANLSLQLGRSLRWDWQTHRVPHDAEANQRLTRPYRAPWDKELQALGVG
ncbi:MAG: Gfo/Idh/MocA family oxidoreductase [Gemmataceae bacterium]|nr:Gfo/Idh/MocA family oxidoreductase [Gemmata sp.]MDW8198173.1 Gfo/Idh/MocA family oxidoreductase [Gemmataceae bacterium]